ncbi:aminopeptidase [Roseateles saccharophilus]|uniref:Putative aminopeptidase n=1 Tax=Roseateles saccharophilus TaxID=304 RepID=A0A4R3UUT2_ROSSA|nr:aminopeptidase [Roseateles saccharophilus]TCU94423.1 putative aminopeptidase [Roseateles saccharophilus]
MTRRLLLAALALCLCGCSAVSHWGQAAAGHLAIMRAARPVDDWLADPATPPELAERLRLAQQMRDFASARLALPDNNSYRRYADLHRPAVVWNVVAAPEFGFELKIWCYPIMGCAGYQGWFDRDAAQAHADALQAEGWEVQVQAIPAYSSLGWSRWLGGDPLLNTFIRDPEGELAAMLFHELAHQRVYAADDTGFNEAYASAVELLGAREWLAAKPEALATFEAGRARRERFLALARQGRERLAAVYAGPPAQRAAAKAVVMAELRARVHGEAPGYETWFQRANNASFAILSAYDELVPAFLRLFEREGRDWPRFHAAVERLKPLEAAERRATLRRLGGPDELDPAPRPAG